MVICLCFSIPISAQNETNNTEDNIDNPLGICGDGNVDAEEECDDRENKIGRASCRERV